MWGGRWTLPTPLLQPLSGQLNFVTLMKPLGLQTTFHAIFKDFCFFFNETKQKAHPVNSLSLKKPLEITKICQIMLLGFHGSHFSNTMAFYQWRHCRGIRLPSSFLKLTRRWKSHISNKLLFLHKTWNEDSWKLPVILHYFCQRYTITKWDGCKDLWQTTLTPMDKTTWWS